MAAVAAGLLLGRADAGCQQHLLLDPFVLITLSELQGSKVCCKNSDTWDDLACILSCCWPDMQGVVAPMLGPAAMPAGVTALVAIRRQNYAKICNMQSSRDDCDESSVCSSTHSSTSCQGPVRILKAHPTLSEQTASKENDILASAGERRAWLLRMSFLP